MSVLPIDLQVLFSKAAEQSENIARQSNTNQTTIVEQNEKKHRESREADDKVNQTEEYSQDFTKINPESKQKRESFQERKKKQLAKEKPEDQEYKRAPIEEGKGKIVDIID